MACWAYTFHGISSILICNKIENLINQFIFYNKNVQVNGMPMYDDEFFKAGIWRVSDWFDAEGHITPFNVWKHRGINNSKYLKWISLVRKIQSLNVNLDNLSRDGGTTKSLHLKDKIVDFEHCKSRELYSALVLLKKLQLLMQNMLTT